MKSKIIDIGVKNLSHINILNLEGYFSFLNNILFRKYSAYPDESRNFKSICFKDLNFFKKSNSYLL